MLIRQQIFDLVELNKIDNNKIPLITNLYTERFLTVYFGQTTE